MTDKKKNEKPSGSSRKWPFTLHIDHSNDKMSKKELRAEQKELEKRIEFYSTMTEYNKKEGTKDSEEWIILKNRGVTFLYYQIERCGKTGRVHLQGYLEIKQKTTLNQVANVILCDTILDGLHLEIMKGDTVDSIKYCSKMDTRMIGPFSFGKHAKGNQGHRTDLDRVIELAKAGKKVYEIALEEPAQYIKFSRGIERLVDAVCTQKAKEWTFNERFKELKVHVIWGASGVGKTRTVFENHDVKDIFSLQPGNGKNVWFYDYSNEPVLLINEFTGWIKYASFLDILDVYPIQCEKKGGHVWNLWKTVYITSNKHPKEWYKRKNKDEIESMWRRFTTVHYINKLGEKTVTEFGNDDTASEETNEDFTLV